MCSSASSCPCSCPAKESFPIPDGACDFAANGGAGSPPVMAFSDVAIAPNGVAVSPAFPMGRNNALQVAALYLSASTPGAVSLISQGSTDGTDWTTISSQNVNNLGCTFLTPDTQVTYRMFRIVLVGPNAAVIFGPVWVWRSGVADPQGESPDSLESNIGMLPNLRRWPNLPKKIARLFRELRAFAGENFLWNFLRLRNTPLGDDLWGKRGDLLLRLAKAAALDPDTPDWVLSELDDFIAFMEKWQRDPNNAETEAEAVSAAEKLLEKLISYHNEH